MEIPSYYIAPPFVSQPTWVKPVLLALGGLFAAIAVLLVVIVWKTRPLGAEALASGPPAGSFAPSVQPQAPLALAPAIPSASLTARAQVTPLPMVEPLEAKAQPAPSPKASRHIRRLHGKAHGGKWAAAKSRGRRHAAAHDPILDLLR
jgi:hypothetical protein